MQFEQTQSQEIDPLLPLQYEQCPHCTRNFFKGKLKYHLKLCTSDNPMVISPKKNARQPSSKLSHHDRPNPNPKEQRTCEECSLKMPATLYEKHAEECPAIRSKPPETPQREEKTNKKSSTDVNFKEREECTLPVIKSAVRQGQARQVRVSEPYQVKLREELSCFRRAQEIKQIQCPACERIFSKEASLRHVPICQTLRNNERLSIALKKRTRVNKSVGSDFTPLPHADRKESSPKCKKPSDSALLPNPQTPN